MRWGVPKPPKLSADQRAALAAIVERGPIPVIHEVVPARRHDELGGDRQIGELTFDLERRQCGCLRAFKRSELNSRFVPFSEVRRTAHRHGFFNQ